jgi:hypothetical protein
VAAARIPLSAAALLVVLLLGAASAPLAAQDAPNPGAPTPTPTPTAAPAPVATSTPAVAATANTSGDSAPPPAATPAPPVDPFVEKLERLRRDYAATLRAAEGIDQKLEALRQLVRDVRDFENRLLTRQRAVARDIDFLLGRRTPGAFSAAPISLAVRIVIVLIGVMVLRTLWKIRRSRLRAERGGPAAAGGPPYTTSPFATPAHGTVVVPTSSGAWGGIALVAFVFISALIVSLLWEPSVILGTSEAADIERVRQLNGELLDLRTEATRLVEQMESVIVESQRARDLVLNVQGKMEEFAQQSANLLGDTPATTRAGWRPLTIILLIGLVIAVVGGVAIWQGMRRVRRQARVAFRTRSGAGDEGRRAASARSAGDRRGGEPGRGGGAGGGRGRGRRGGSRDYDPSLDD